MGTRVAASMGYMTGRRFMAGGAKVGSAVGADVGWRVGLLVVGDEVAMGRRVRILFVGDDVDGGIVGEVVVLVADTGLMGLA